MRTAALGGSALDYQTPSLDQDFSEGLPVHIGQVNVVISTLHVPLAGWMVNITLHALPNLGPFPLRPYFSINDHQLKQPTRINNIKSLPPILGTYRDPPRYFLRVPYCTSYSKSWLYMSKLFHYGRSFHSYIRNRKDTERIPSREIPEGKLEAPKRL